MSGCGEVFTASQDYKADDTGSVTLHRGEKVILVSTKGPDPSKRTRYEFEDDNLEMDFEELLDSTAAKHKMAVRPKRKYERRIRQNRWSVQSLEEPEKKGFVPIVVLQPHEESPETTRTQDLIYRKEAVISELVETEEEYCRDLMKVVERYLKPLDGPKVPRYVCDQKDLIFGNLKEIAVFHNTVLLEGIKFYANEAKALGRTFLRMERDFDKHVAYCHDEPAAQDFLQESYDVREYFEDLASRLHDDKNLTEHLKLPIQRINDYQLLLKELIKYCDRLDEDTTDLNKALELMLGIPHRAEDLKFITNIEGYHGDIHKLGRLLRHNWFKVKTKDGKAHDRYLFLFKARILICKVRKVAENRFVFGLKEIIRLPEVELHDHKQDPRSFEVGPYKLTSHQEHIKEPWIAEIKHYARNVLTLAEHAADDLRLQEEENKNLEPLKGVELSLSAGQSLSDEEMDRSSRKTSLSRRVEEIRSGSITEVTEVHHQVEEIVCSSSSVISQEIIIEEDTSSRCIIDNSLFTKTIEGINVEPGGCASFECEIDAKSVIWLKDNHPLSDRLADRVTQMSVGNLHRLEILNVAESDAGVYTAHATTSKGVISTCTANLVVKTLSDEELRALKAPCFLVMLRDTELLENTYLRFMVKVKGDPMPTVEFFKDDQLITYKNERIAIQSENADTTGYYEVVIPEVQTTDTGVYKCVATNKYGEATCEGTVTVVDDKNIFKGLDDKTAPEFSWIKDGEPFDPEERFKVLFQDEEDSLALVFTHVKPEDAGLYTCVASTYSGKISCSAELTVQGNVNLLFREPESPKIVSKSIKAEANIGSSAMLETKITGYPRPEIKWMKDDEEILMSDKFKLLYEDEETISLVIKNVTLNDRGEYHVIASNLSGIVEDIITLDVKAAPTFTKKLTDVRTTSGKEVRLTVEVDANPRPMVAWYKDGKQILESEHIKLNEKDNSYTLLIENCSLLDVGSYSVVCKNNISQISEFCKVEIEGAPIFTKNLIKRVELEEGDSLTFLVKVHGAPMPNVQWLYKDKPVVQDARCKTGSDADTHTLTINAITTEDAGDYCCKLTNLHGSNCDFGKVCVKSRPEFIKGLGHLIAQEGDTNVGFSVEVNSLPKGKVQWFHNDVELSENDKSCNFKEAENTYTLVLKEVSRDSKGTYTCKVKNDYGENETSADLTVLCKPRFPKPLTNVTVNEGDTLTLRVEVDATPPAEIKWFKDGQELSSDAHIKITRDKHRVETFELSVTLVRAEDGGEYEVKALNEMGTAITKSNVTVQTTSTDDEYTSPQPCTKQEITMTDDSKNVEEVTIVKKPLVPTEDVNENVDIISKNIDTELQNIEIEQSEKKLNIGSLSGSLKKLKYCDAKTLIWDTVEPLKGFLDIQESNVEPQRAIILENFSKYEIQEFSMAVSCIQVDDTQSVALQGTLEGKMEVSETKSYHISAANEDRKEYCQVHEVQNVESPQILKLELLERNGKNEAIILSDDDDDNDFWSDLKGQNGHQEKCIIPFDNNDASSDVIIPLSIKKTEKNDKSDSSKISSDQTKRQKSSTEDAPEIQNLTEKSDENVPVHGVISDEEKPTTELGKSLKRENKEEKDEVSPKQLTKTNSIKNKDDCRKSSISELQKGISESEEKKLSKQASIDENKIKIGAQKQTSPIITKSEMKTVDIFETWEHTFQVEAIGNPYPVAHWFKDEEEISASKRFNISDENGKYKLQILDCQLEDTATYKVVVKNVLGEASDAADLNIILAKDFRLPQIIKPLEDLKVPKTQTAIMKLVLTADPIPDVTWLHDGKDINPDFVTDSATKMIEHGLKECTYTLSIPSSRHDDTGTYNFKATNKSGSCEANARLDVILKPEIKLFKDINGVPYEDAQFIAVIHSNPRATITWRKDGEKISAGGHYDIDHDSVNEVYKLRIKNILLEDGGLYTVSAVNSVGECSADARLKIHMEEPVFTKTLEDVTVREYAALDLKVRAQGVPKPEISWLKDGLEIEISEGMSLDTRCEGSVSSHFNIPHFKEEHAGKYKVRAYNVGGHVDTQCYVKLALLSPSFSKSLGRAVTVEEGEPLELKCKIESSPSASIKWFKDGEELKESDRVKLIHNPDGLVKLQIAEATPADCGAYKLCVENSLGTDYSICAVAVNPSPRAPVFTKKLEDLSVIEGEPMFLQAQVMGFPLPELKWYKDGLPVRSSKAINFVNSPGGLVGLSIEKANVENAGQYSLTVVNKLGECSSAAEVDVVIKDRRPEFKAHLTPQTIVEGFPAKLTVKVGGNPSPDLSWNRDGSPVDIDGEHVKIVSAPDGSESLLIDKVSPLDSGLYSVTAKNLAGSLTSEAKIEVVSGQIRPDMPVEPPSFPYKMRDAFSEEGSPISLSVPFAGNPCPEVKWFKDDKEIFPDYRITFLNNGFKVGLQIEPCELKDIGTYVCKLKNELGETENTAKMNIKKVFHAPVFVQKLHDLEQIIGLDGKLLCRVTGNPRPDVAWYWNGKPIYEGNRYKIKREGDTCILYIKDCSPDEDGYYKCIASNRDGKDETEAQFRAVDKIGSREKGEPPCFLKKIGDQELVGGLTGRFTACISGYPEPEVEWYRNNERLYPSERITIERESTGLLRLSIAHVDPLVDEAKYKVRIFNDFGEDECEASFIFDSMGLGERHSPGGQFKDFEEFKNKGSPMPLADKPIISRMSDRRLTLSWKPSIPFGPRDPVTYQVEMCELPKGDWFTARSGIRSCACEIRNLEPFRDYKFRVRVENKHGISDPSPYAITYRSKLEPDTPKFIPYLAPGIDFRPESSPYFSKDFDIERPPHDGYAQAPRFLRQEHYTQYGVKGHNCNLFWFVYGYPKPKMTYYFNDEVIEMGGRYDASYTRNGQATLFINKMLDRDVGTYEAVATNEHGEARQRVHLEIAEYPEFIRRPEEMIIIQRQSGKLEARVTGVPPPEIRWYKDWQLLAPTSRIKISQYDPDHCVLLISDAILKDSGLYSITASNVAGAVSSSVMVHVEEKEEHPYHHYGRGHGVKARTKPLQDHYDLGDELGRGTQGVTYHAVERATGRNYAAKIMHGRGELKSFMHNEVDILNILNSHKIVRIHDAAETLNSVTIIMELASGGELLDVLTRQPYTNESEIASYIRQLLYALDHMHEQNIAHLGLTPGDLLTSHPGGDDLKLCDFGLSRRIHPGQLEPLDYGMPEFVSPETIRGEGVDVSSDMWSVGVITYLLLTGTSLFRGSNDMETLNKVKEGFWEFDDEIMRNYSLEVRDFITKLLVINPGERLDVKAAMRHPWLNYADRLPPNDYSISTEKLHNYYNLWKDWYNNASCRTWFRRRPLEGAFHHPSRMVYPPNYMATPMSSPEREIKDKDSKPSWVNELPSRQPLNYDIGLVSSESHYQNGPDTYLLQLRDVDFPVRIREYMKVAAYRGSGVTRFPEDNHLDWKMPVIRERRRFTDVMDEEIDDERKDRINQYGLGDSYTVRRLKHELGARLDTHVEAEALIEATRHGQAPFMREKPQGTPIQDGKPAELVCYAVGDPRPSIQWFKNDMMLGSSNRIKIEEDEKGRSFLKFQPAIGVDAGIYKAVARNRVGQTVSRARLVLATTPDAPDSPQMSEVSDTQVLLRWKQPKHDGHSPVMYYNLQYKLVDDSEWRNVPCKIEHEFYLVHGLKPASAYIFRLSSHNAVGVSEPGIPSEITRTLEEGCAPIKLSQTMQHLQALSEMDEELRDDQKLVLDYSVERNPIEWKTQSPSSKYTFISEISRGRFSVVVKGIDKTTDKIIVAKILENSANSKAKVEMEFEGLRSLRHERIATLLEAYMPLDEPYCALILEKLQGADILTYFASRHEYTEHMVASVISQVLDALQYLHWRNICHLDLQPDNIVMASLRSLQVKLVDFGSEERVTKLGNVVRFHGNIEFTAPEVICQEPAYPTSDIWSVGVLAYVLLSGVSPFLGENIGETRQNINFVRFRYEYLYKEITQEATRFLMLVFKRAPNKRPSAEECNEHRWLLPSEYMIKRRERAIFLGSRLKEFNEKYHQTKIEEASTLEALTCLVTGKGPLQRSNSIQEELVTNEF